MIYFYKIFYVNFFFIYIFQGIGKSTLLKIILNKTGLDSGEYKWGSEVDVSYFS